MSLEASVPNRPRRCGRKRYLFGLAIAALSLGQPRADEAEITVGHNTALQLKPEIGFGQPLLLPVSVFPGIPGYATGELGFHSTILDDPSEDFFPLSPTADLRLILIAKDPGMEVWNDHGSAFMQPGEAFFVGPPVFDTHPVWNLVEGALGKSYALTLKLTDVNRVYSDSEPFTLSFTPNPPVLIISPAAPGSVSISWSPATPGFVLQVAATLEPTAWTNAPSEGTTPITIPVSSSRQFFRVIR